MLILGIVPVIFLGVFSYLISSNSLESSNAKEKEQIIYQIQLSVEQGIKTVDHSLTNFVMTPLVNRLLDEPMRPNQFPLYRQTKKELNYIQRFETGVEDIYFVNLTHQWMIRNDGLKRISEAEKEKLIEEYQAIYRSSWKIEDSNFFFKNEDNHSTCKYYLNLVKHLPLAGISEQGMAIASIPLCNLNNHLGEKIDGERTIIANKEYQVIADSEEDQIGKNIEKNKFIEELKERHQQKGQFEIDIDEEVYHVTYRKSNYNGWNYINIVKLNVLNAPSHAIGWLTLGISSIIVFGLVLISIIGSKRLYQPISQLSKTLTQALKTEKISGASNDEFLIMQSQINRMVEQNESLENKLSVQKDHLNQFLTTKLMQGKIAEKDIAYVVNGDEEEAINYTVLSIQIDSVDNTKFIHGDDDVLLFAINTMIEEIISEDIRFAPIVLEDKQVTLLKRKEADQETWKKHVLILTEMLQTTIRQVLGIPVSFGISNSFLDLRKAHQAFVESEQALKHSLNFGEESIIFFSNIESKYTFYTTYPKQIENELFEAIKLGDKENVDKKTEEIIDALFNEDLNYIQYEISMMRFLNNLMELIEMLAIDVLQINDRYSLFSQLAKFKTKTDIISWFRTNIIYPVLEKLNERSNEHYYNLSDEMVHIVQKEYDKDISLELIAERLFYNASYLSSVFRREKNVSFSEYLSQYRLKKAKELLVHSDISVKDIAQKLRYNNSQNFIRSFRKQEGTTPGKFRSEHRIN
ncbi:AraC family transcriptional regulator [Saliterribacillus persicus]|uniref:AraC family transcriptional regulator n=2 Tax=Saliterribacillus persicus TaxID=930114 RepID=A0A368YDR0_9BACI|nr:AraC family transcriptional regulator [Saliterribacillus persicus]